jgi:ribulose-5-phosphate 4-epimerase/fuculose-1-phosphate aldolase
MSPRTTSRVTYPGSLKERRAVTAANKSLCAGKDFLITPTGINYEAIKPAHIV